jgi:hypothetical protein
MKRFILTFALGVSIAGDLVMAAVPTHNDAQQITANPELETATDTFTILRIPT